MTSGEARMTQVRGLEPTGRRVVWQQSLRKRRFLWKNKAQPQLTRRWPWAEGRLWGGELRSWLEPDSDKVRLVDSEDRCSFVHRNLPILNTEDKRGGTNNTNTYCEHMWKEPTDSLEIHVNGCLWEKNSSKSEKKKHVHRTTNNFGTWGIKHCPTITIYGTENSLQNRCDPLMV